MTSETEQKIVSILERLEKTERYRSGAWSSVIESGKQYARLKCFGWMIEDGRRVMMSDNDKQMMIDHFEKLVLRECVKAMSEEIE